MSANGKRRPWYRPRRTRRAQRWAMGVVVLTLVWAGFTAHAAYQRILAYPERQSELAAPVSLEVPRGASFPRVLRLMVDEGVLSEDEAVYFKVFVLHKGAAGKITAGPHVFTEQMTPTELLAELTRRQPAQEVRVTVPEGKNMLEVAAILAEAGLGDAAAFEAAMRDRAVLDRLEIPGETMEGYLFPDTYKFPTRAEPQDVLERLVKRHRQVFAGIKRNHREAARRLGERLDWGDHQIVTLASIVEKETSAPHERPLIAGVFLNRLKFKSFQPKLLQTDPTIVYGCTVPRVKSAACKKFEGRIRRIHLNDKDNAYSTYANEGLPPGPISNPGRAALEAVFAPKKSRFLYFVSRNDGTHQFSKTVAEHEKWVELYQRQGRVGDGSKAGAAGG